MDVKRAWRKDPPQADITTLGGLVTDFKQRFPNTERDTVMEVAARAPTLAKAINAACASIGTNGKQHNHQSRVSAEARKELASVLKAKQRQLRSFTDFDQLHDFIAELGVAGIGPVTMYDVATRVGAWLELSPESVYLHAGVQGGALALGLVVKGDKVDRIARAALPVEFMQLTADEAEDFLCTYRTTFKPTMVKVYPDDAI